MLRFRAFAIAGKAAATAARTPATMPKIASGVGLPSLEDSTPSAELFLSPGSAVLEVDGSAVLVVVAEVEDFSELSAGLEDEVALELVGDSFGSEVSGLGSGGRVRRGSLGARRLRGGGLGV